MSLAILGTTEQIYDMYPVTIESNWQVKGCTIIEIIPVTVQILLYFSIKMKPITLWGKCG